MNKDGNMWLIAWQHRLAAVLLMFGSAATVLSFAGCETAPSKDKPTAAAKSGDKQAGETNAADSGSDDAKETMDEATATEPAALEITSVTPVVSS